MAFPKKKPAGSTPAPKPKEPTTKEVCVSLLESLSVLEKGLTVGIDYDKQLLIDAFNKWGEDHGIKY